MPILKPFQVLNPVRMVPNGALTVDWTHPLTRGLIGAWIPGAMRGVDLTGKAPTLALSTSTLDFINATQEGAGLDSTNASSSIRGMSALATPDFLFSTAQTQYWRGSIVNAGGGFTTLMGINYNAAHTTPFNVAELGPGSVGWSGTTCFQPFWNSGGGQQSFNPTLSSSLTPPVAIVSLAVSFDVTNNLVTAYQNGAQIGTSAGFGSGAPTTTVTSSINVGGDISDASVAGNGAITNCAYYWNRILTATEMAWLDTDPYSFIIPAGESELPVTFLPPAALPMMGQIWI